MQETCIIIRRCKGMSRILSIFVKIHEKFFKKTARPLPKGGVCGKIWKKHRFRQEKNMFHVVLVEPEIPQNAGNIARTCAATGCTLHLIKPLGFEISDKYLKRAGLDYWHLVHVVVHEDWQAFLDDCPQGARMHFFTTKARRAYCEAAYRAEDYLVFGKETKGLPEELLVAHPKDCVRIPMREEARSLNLSNSVAIAVYEGLRQNAFAGLEQKGELHRLQWDD